MALSQMMQHWVTVKEKYKDCLIFYRLGDFYEMFFDDAKKASQLLNLTLTGRDCGLAERAPMCGVPHHSAEAYITKLVSMGEKVAICEQIEDASQAKGMVAREVVRVVTAGTLNCDVLNERANNFICCAFKEGSVVALAWADITTGEFRATEFYGEECVNKSVAQMAVLDVKEVIGNDDMVLSVKDMPEITRGVVPRFSNYPEWAFGFAAAERTLSEQLGAKTLSAFSISEHKPAVSAAGALLEYLKETQMHSLKNIDGIKYVVNEKFMQMDAAAQRNLEITKNLNEGTKYGSLLWLLDRTKTPMGARYLHSNLLYPFYDKKLIDERLDGVQELYAATVARLGIVDMLKEIKDVERIAGKVSNNTINPRDCLNLSRSLQVVPNLRFSLTGFNSAVMREILDDLCDLSEVCNLLEKAISPDAQANMKDGEYIKEGFNERLDELRNIVKNGTGLIGELESRERDKTGIRNLRVGYNRVFGYYIEITKSMVDKAPLEYQRRQTLANGERFITDELKQLEEKILTSGDQSLRLEAEI